MTALATIRSEPSAASANLGASWLSVLAASACVFWVIQPGLMVSGALAGLAGFLMAGMALAAVRGAEMQSWQHAITYIAPVQIALLAWLTFSAAGGFFGGAVLLAGLVAFDFALSVGLLAALERASGGLGASAALLISSKYAGFGGRLA